MKAELRNSENIYLLGINIHVVGWTGKRRRLNKSANRSGIVSFDLPFVGRSEAFDVIVVPRKLPASASHINRVASNEFFFARILQVLPARHPGHGRVRNVVGGRGLAQQLGQVSVTRAAV